MGQTITNYADPSECADLLNKALLAPVDPADDGPQVSLVEALAVLPGDGRQKKDLFLKVRSQIEQLHDLCHASPCHPAPARPAPIPTIPLTCAPRSYLINAFNDYFQSILSTTDWTAYINGTYSSGMKEIIIKYPSETIIFGEKKTEAMDYYMDFYEGDGNDVERVEQSRQDGAGPGSNSGGSDYAMADGSATYIRFPGSLSPVNLWAVTDAARTNYAVSY